MAALSGVAIHYLLFQQFTHRIDLGKDNLLVNIKMFLLSG